MLCNNGDTVRLNSMAKQLKSGYLLRYKKRLFGKDWREDYVALYSDSTLAWFRDKERLEPDGGVVIREAPHLIAVGQWTAKIPNRPDLPPGRTMATLLAFGTKNKDKVHWFLCKDEEDLNDWMTAISNTLPPPPFPQGVRNGAAAVDSSGQPVYSPYTPAPPASSPAGYCPPPPPYSEVSSQLRVDNYPMQPQPGYRPAQPMIQPSAPAPASTPATTVIVQQGGRPAGGNMDGFATGMVTGTMLGSALNPPGWGWGWGFGLGWGGGFGWGNHAWGGGVGFYNNDPDIHINNHYQINNHISDNDVNVNNETYIDASDTHNSLSGGFGADTLNADCDDDYDMGYDTGLGDTGFDGGCDFAF